jgi:formylglycine-generating enzyme required for sulfatase activity
MGKYEVTKRQWDRFADNNPSERDGCYDCPVENVSWEQVNRFIEQAKKETNLKLRLPTEAEWEYAAGGGTTHQIWAGTNIEGETVKYAWHLDRSATWRGSHPTGQKKSNKFGLYDMSGNVSEWCLDWYSKDYYRFSNKDDPRGPSTGTHKVYRGGSFNTIPEGVSTRSRSGMPPSAHAGYIGFRLVIKNE